MSESTVRTIHYALGDMIERDYLYKSIKEIYIKICYLL